MKSTLSARAFAFTLLLLGLLLGATAQAAGKDRLAGHWKYASGESEGSNTAVYGDLKLKADGTFEDNRRIGGIGGFRKGSYSVSGERVTLKYDGGKSSQTYTFAFGTQQDRTGKAFETLLLRGTGLSFLLTRKE
jgi:hypothetical protein